MCSKSPVQMTRSGIFMQKCGVQHSEIAAARSCKKHTFWCARLMNYCIWLTGESKIVGRSSNSTSEFACSSLRYIPPSYFRHDLDTAGIHIPRQVQRSFERPGYVYPLRCVTSSSMSVSCWCPIRMINLLGTGGKMREEMEVVDGMRHGRGRLVKSLVDMKRYRRLGNRQQWRPWWVSGYWLTARPYDHVLGVYRQVHSDPHLGTGH